MIGKASVYCLLELENIGFINKGYVMTKSKHSRDDLLNQCESNGTLDESDLAWINAESVGKEVIDELLVDRKINHVCFLKNITRTLNDFSQKNIALEICDLANELGLMFGKASDDKPALILEFIQGFKHGVDLSKNKHSC